MLLGILDEIFTTYRPEISDVYRASLDLDGLRFAWIGGTKKGEPHYYRIQTSDFLFEFDNVQGNANHIHEVWRSRAGDFGEDLLRHHRAWSTDNAMIVVEPLEHSPQADSALEALLYETYVRGGFTDAILAASLLAAAVRARGEVLAAHDRNRFARNGDARGAKLPARRLATREEFELHLLCVRPDARRRGIGEALVRAALQRAQSRRRTRRRAVDAANRWSRAAALPAMRVRARPSADFSRGARQFLVPPVRFSSTAP
jgi:GNAT superfamily N-acetyltransferase